MNEREREREREREKRSKPARSQTNQQHQAKRNKSGGKEGERPFGDLKYLSLGPVE
jgi:hypothetical protein